uniref:DLH domain-containing protein n=1 Tax=Macrostomum lignano TaxID=282301 RepID=A0A1I8H898_9PLAT
MATEVCCSSGSPSNNSNSGSGSIVTDSGVRNYITGSGKGRGLVLIHDIFGLDIGQTRQFADDLAAKAEATVVMPDLFHGGEAWSLARFPPPDKTEFGNWLSTTANADKAAKAILDQTMPIALLPASDDPDMQKLLEELRDQPFYSRCVHRRYDGVSHGFCAARGDRNDAKQMEKILDARDTLAKFFIDNA